MTRCLADLLGGTSPPHDVVLTGPRGNGKTVLLNWFERTCRDHETEVDVVNLTPDDIPTPTRSPRSSKTASAIRTSSNSGARPCGSDAWPPARPGWPPARS